MSDAEIHPAAGVAFALIFGVFILARPCDPVGNCLGSRQVIIGLASATLWGVTLAVCWEVVLA